MKKVKGAKAVSVIGGAHGPTSIFIAGHPEKGFFRRLKLWLVNRSYKRKSALAAKSIIPVPHTAWEVIQYIQTRYGAVEADSSYWYYHERKKSMRYALIQRMKPSLLGPQKTFLPPENWENEESVKEWQRQIDEWHQECQKRVDAIPDEVFPTDYHLFLIQKKDHGTLEIEIDTLCPDVSISYSGDKKIMEPIIKDIYLYFGVSQEDIDGKSLRYRALLAALSC